MSCSLFLAVPRWIDFFKISMGNLVIIIIPDDNDDTTSRTPQLLQPCRDGFISHTDTFKISTHYEAYTEQT